MKNCRFHRFCSGNGYSDRRFFHRFSVDSSVTKNLRVVSRIPQESMAFVRRIYGIYAIRRTIPQAQTWADESTQGGETEPVTSRPTDMKGVDE